MQPLAQKAKQQNSTLNQHLLICKLVVIFMSFKVT